MVQIYTKLSKFEVNGIVDLATGQGGFLEQICGYFKNYQTALGVDSSEKAIKAASGKEWNAKISFREMNCEKLDFENESFDVVTICNSIHHFKNRDLILAEALRILKKDGFFIISEMFHSSDERPSQRTHSGFHHWWGDIDSALGHYHGKTFTEKKLYEIISSLPLSSVEVEKFDGEDEDIYSDEILNHLKNAFNMYRKKAENLENADFYITRGEALLEKLNTDGFAPASRLEFICRK